MARQLRQLRQLRLASNTKEPELGNSSAQGNWVRGESQACLSLLVVLNVRGRQRFSSGACLPGSQRVYLEVIMTTPKLEH